MFGLSKFLEFTIYILQRSSYVKFASEYYANNKPDVKIFGKQFSGYNKLVFKFNIVQVSLNRLTTPFSKTWDKSIPYLGEV